MATLESEFDRRLRALLTDAQAAGYQPQVASGYRSPQDQARAIDSVSRNVLGRPASVVEFARGVPGYAAPVGGSMHQKGQAADITGTGLDWMRQNAGNYGVRFPQSLSQTDPNHLEVDPKFMGPVQDPRDRVDIAMPPAEVPASKGGTPPPPSMDAEAQPGGFYGQMPRPQPPSPTSVASYQARMPLPVAMPQQQQPKGFIQNLNDYLSSTLRNPLFNAGAALVDAGSKGLNVGAGVLSGAKAYGSAAQMEAEDAKRRRDMMSEQNRAALWNDMVTNPSPGWASDLPAGSLDLARALGPEVGSKLVIDLVSKHASSWLDRAKLDETRRANIVKEKQAEAQMVEAQNMNNERRDLMRSQAEMRRNQIEQERQAAERRRQLLEGDTPAAITSVPTPQPPSVDPNIRQQSFEDGEPEPQLIQAQTVPPTPAQAQAQTQTPPGMPTPAPVTVDVPGRGKMSADDAIKYGTRLTLDPELRIFGQNIIKQAQDAKERSGLSSSTRSDVEKSLISDISHLSRLNDIAKSYEDEYLLAIPRGKNAILGMAEYAGLPVKPEDQEKMAKFAEFRRRTIASFNLLLKEASGAAVTEQEFRRMTLQEPNAEANGWFSRPDSPTEFKAKLNSARRDLVSAIARKNYLRNVQGLSDADIAKLTSMPNMPVGLDQMKGIMGEQQRRIEREFRIQNPRIKPEQLQPLVRDRMRGIFGI